ncbi:MAG: DinB family protein [Phycisphaerales bacterium]
MMQSDPLDILLDHNRWATNDVLDACNGLSTEQWHQAFPMGLESLHATLRHVVAAIRAWSDVLAQREARPRLEEGGDLTVAAIKSLHDEAADEFDQLARTHPLDEVVTREWRGKTYTFTRGAVITHVATHGMHHRAQCLNMLRQLGVDTQTLPNPSVLNWTLQQNPPHAS